jgi:hypothetical protein
VADTPAPPRGLGQANTGKTFAKAFGADINLRTQALMPPHAAQLVDATNETTQNESIEFVTDDGKTLTKVIPAGATYPIPVAVASIGHANTGENISIAAYWWDASGLPRNPA